MEQLAPAWPKPTLAVHAAKTLAIAWSRNMSLMPDFCKTTDSQTNIIFKVQVAIFLKDTYFVKWIQSQGGLAQISALVWSHLFLFWLTSLFLDISNIETPPLDKQLLTDIIKEYDNTMKETTQLNHVMHRLSLTLAFYHSAFLHEREKKLSELLSLSTISMARNGSKNSHRFSSSFCFAKLHRGKKKTIFSRLSRH